MLAWCRRDREWVVHKMHCKISSLPQARTSIHGQLALRIGTDGYVHTMDELVTQVYGREMFVQLLKFIQRFMQPVESKETVLQGNVVAGIKMPARPGVPIPVTVWRLKDSMLKDKS